jgi:hypothetical protein
MESDPAAPERAHWHERTNAAEAVQDGRIYVEQVNAPFRESWRLDQYRAALARATELGWLWLHESGTYVKFTPAGAKLFA